MNCLTDRIALLTTSTSGVLALLLSHLPHTWDEWAAAVAIVSGLVGLGLNTCQFAARVLRRRRRRPR